jgi:uncharacterized membrane protein YhfC
VEAERSARTKKVVAVALTVFAVGAIVFFKKKYGW